MIPEEDYVQLLADLLNRDSDSRERERRVREANRRLYKAVVERMGTTAQADLALAKAAQKERLK